jgi:hypothetical protein
MWHVYVYVPGVANCLSTDTFALFPAMSAGAPTCVAKKTLWGTEPNVNLTMSPALTRSVAGVNAIASVASTVLPGGGGATVEP